MVLAVDPTRNAYQAGEPLGLCAVAASGIVVMGLT
jgi:hypothetical protein